LRVEKLPTVKSISGGKFGELLVRKISVLALMLIEENSIDYASITRRKG
jgi:hypothetical protein